MATIEIDFDVYKELTARRTTEAVSENDVIRDLLKLPPKPQGQNPAPIGGKPWMAKGISFPHGTEFRRVYKGQQFTGVVRDGALVVNGRSFTSPSAAARSITHSAVNGWNFWECKLPGSSNWTLMESLKSGHTK